MDAAEIKRSLPHRYPMLLVDRVLELVPGESLVAIKAVTCNEPWYSALDDAATVEGFGYPPTLLVESWGQAAGLLALRPGADTRTAGQVMLAGAMSGVEFLRPVHPGEVLEHRVRVVRAVSDAVIFEGESLVDGEVVMRLSHMVMAFRPGDRLRPAGAV
ncbi:hotdog domain-containing protein [Streptomyces sp. SL13]|uniref:Hotdog domain-containing protein n=1 Tax=Streptantibioticus silvisoli TaxID=2705255 RepID=A0AA90GTV6_9ACTN|nr:hotdog domain-containing protein [Streptantibioticus silvisoli]MDI5962457.1 hotdog domain-containing protein [Streptantibioticus silvisoli]MDI5967968.1 hotdog domain-containing protein [Streptantibioticus silvisoli]